MKTYTDKIAITKHPENHCQDSILGDLTDRQYGNLQKTAELSPGYLFEVVQYSGGPSSRATHVRVYKDSYDSTDVALVGVDCAEYYDSDPETLRVVKRVAHRVFKRSVYFD